MIINIPLNIPDEMLANTIAKDYEAKITERLTDEVRKAICDRDAYRDRRRGLAVWVGEKIDDILKEYKRCLELIRKYLKNETLKLDEKKLDSIISKELEKPANEMDTQLIDLCLNALVVYRVYISERDKQM